MFTWPRDRALRDPSGHMTVLPEGWKQEDAEGQHKAGEQNGEEREMMIIMEQLNASFLILLC